MRCEARMIGVVIALGCAVACADAGPELLENSIGMKLKLLPAGTFTMGQVGGGTYETPHQVTLTKPFYMGVYEVKNAQ